MQNINQRYTTRTHCRSTTMEDLIHELLKSCDLYIAELRQEWEKDERILDPEITQLLEKIILKTKPNEIH